MASYVTGPLTIRFFLWQYLKSKVYATAPNNIDILKERIVEEWAITANTFIRVQELSSRVYYFRK